MSDEIHHNALQPGYQIHWYRIKNLLGQGGFGITYLAEDTNLQTDVAIKEYFPIGASARGDDRSVRPVSKNHENIYHLGLTRFLDEARTLARFKHPNIVRVFSVFESNGAAYMVMEYEHGQSLSMMLAGHKTLSESAVLQLLDPILDGLEQVHEQGFIHRDLKPANIFVRADGSPVLLDFGAARNAYAQETADMTSFVSIGYTPFEQYVGKSQNQGPWTDIYGLGATCYRALSGIHAVDAMSRSAALLQTLQDPYVPLGDVAKNNCSSRVLAAIDHALAFKREDRPQNITEWQAELGLGRRPQSVPPQAKAMPPPSTGRGETSQSKAKERSDTSILGTTRVFPKVQLAPSTVHPTRSETVAGIFSSAKSRVAETQHLLCKLGYDPGGTDGLLERKTVTAIMAYQTDRGLPDNGQISERLLESLRSAQ